MADTTAPATADFPTVPGNFIDMALPSRGYPYRTAGGDSLIPGGRVKIREMTGVEESILNTPGLADHIKVSKIINACTLLPRTGIKHNDLLITDRLILICMIRSVTFGSKWRLNAKSTAGPFDVEIDLATDLAVEEMPREKKDAKGKVIGTYEYDPVEGIPCKLPVSQQEVRLRLLTAGDDEFIQSEIRKGNNSKFITDRTGSDPTFFLRTALSIKAMQNTKGEMVPVNQSRVTDVTEIIDHIKSWSMRDTVFLDRTYANYDVGIARTFEAMCPMTGAEVEIPFALNAEFFRPTNID